MDYANQPLNLSLPHPYRKYKWSNLDGVPFELYDFGVYTSSRDLLAWQGFLVSIGKRKCLPFIYKTAYRGDAVYVYTIFGVMRRLYDIFHSDGIRSSMRNIYNYTNLHMSENSKFFLYKHAWKDLCTFDVETFDTAELNALREFIYHNCETLTGYDVTYWLIDKRKPEHRHESFDSHDLKFSVSNCGWAEYFERHPNV
jgi:hypothetical protein